MRARGAAVIAVSAPHDYVPESVASDATPEQLEVRRVARALKQHGAAAFPAAVVQAARAMRGRLPHHAVVVPVPGAGGSLVGNLALAHALVAGRTGMTVVAALARVIALPSQRLLRLAGQRAQDIDAQRRSLIRRCVLPADRPVVLVDNLVVSGATSLAAATALGRPDAIAGPGGVVPPPEEGQARSGELVSLTGCIYRIYTLPCG
jgi:hypothetical protein